MKRDENGYPEHRSMVGARGGAERRTWAGEVSDDPVGMAAALIEIRRPFVVALTLSPTTNPTGGFRESASDIAIFSTNGALLAGRRGDPRSEVLLARAASDCFARRTPGVIEIRQDRRMFDASPASSSVLRAYIEPVLWK